MSASPTSTVVVHWFGSRGGATPGRLALQVRGGTRRTARIVRSGVALLRTGMTTGYIVQMTVSKIMVMNNGEVFGVWMK